MKELNSLLKSDRCKWEVEKKVIEDELSSEKRITQWVQEESDQKALGCCELHHVRDLEIEPQIRGPLFKAICGETRHFSFDKEKRGGVQERC